jgi:hypothetical protein
MSVPVVSESLSRTVGVRRQREKAKELIMTTSKKDASTAGKLLSNPKTPKKVKSVAGSDLAQAKGGKRKK